MKCPNCGAENKPGVFCVHCGSLLAATPTVPTPPTPSVPTPVPTPVPVPKITSEDQLPEQYRPLGAWAYFGLQLLFAIPIVGFILLIVFSCSSGNINRRNFARSYWCALVIIGVIVLIYVVIAAFLGIALYSGF